MNRSENIRPIPQNLRYTGFANQQAPPNQNRNVPLGSGRLQNSSRLTNGTGWGLQSPPNGAPGLPNSQSRQLAGATSFAQTIGGSQPATPLDMSEFPSLSGNSQPQYQNPNSALWRQALGQPAVQRPQPQQTPAAQQQLQQHHVNQQQRQDQSSQSNEDKFSATSNLQGELDDFLRPNQGSVGQPAGLRQPQTTNHDDFPPLGRNGTDQNDHDLRGNMMQNNTYGNFPTSNGFPLPPNRAPGLPNTQGNHADPVRSSSVAERIMSPTNLEFRGPSNARSPADPLRHGHIGMQQHDRNHLVADRGPQSNDNAINSLPSLPSFQSQRPQADYTGQIGDPPTANHTPDQIPLSQMSQLDQYGLAGFLATVRDDPQLARGHDLTTLGLNLNSPEPLHETWGGPFAEPDSRPLQPDFVLPECYTVDNVQDVKNRIPGFSDDTLFYMFYSQPRDYLQALAAQELNNRNWRFHKQEKQWLTKDVHFAEPQRIPDGSGEYGTYIFFDERTWEKKRKANFLLDYAQLHPLPARSSA